LSSLLVTIALITLKTEIIPSTLHENADFSKTKNSFLRWQLQLIAYQAQVKQ
jgi:hypothetical protein